LTSLNSLASAGFLGDRQSIRIVHRINPDQTMGIATSSIVNFKVVPLTHAFSEFGRTQDNETT
jgi:hypothetical protein